MSVPAGKEEGLLVREMFRSSFVESARPSAIPSGSHKAKCEQSQTCTLIYPFLAFLLLGFRVYKSKKKKMNWHAPSWVSAVIFAGPASTPLEHISFCWRLGGPPRHSCGWSGRSRQWLLHQGGTRQRVTHRHYSWRNYILLHFFIFCIDQLFHWRLQHLSSKHWYHNGWKTSLPCYWTEAN